MRNDESALTLVRTHNEIEVSEMPQQLPADVARCPGDGCDLADQCARAVSPPHDRQVYMMPTSVGENCEHFWSVFSASRADVDAAEEIDW